MIRISLFRSLKNRLCVVFILAFLLFAGFYLHCSNDTRSPIDVSGGVLFDGSKPLSCSLYLQRDQRWRNERIGGSGETIAAVGCMLCCVSMAFECHGIPMPPDKLNALLKAHDGYTRKGWIIWKSVESASKGKLKVDIPVEVSHELIDISLRKQNPVLAKVLLPGNIPHWVLIVGKEGAEYVIADPLGMTGDLESLAKFGSRVFAIRIIARNHPSS